MLSDIAIKYFEQGYSCSESVVKAAFELKLIDIDFSKFTTGFSGGMGSGCVCGAVAGSQCVLSYLNQDLPKSTVKLIASKFVEKFQKQYKVCCCRILTRAYEHDPIERRKNCVNIVQYCSKILEEMVKEEYKGNIYAK